MGQIRTFRRKILRAKGGLGAVRDGFLGGPGRRTARRRRPSYLDQLAASVLARKIREAAQATHAVAHPAGGVQNVRPQSIVQKAKKFLRQVFT